MYIYTEKIGSLFARKIQDDLKNKVKNKVLRSNKKKYYVNSNCFYVEPDPWNKIEQLQLFHSNGLNCPQFATSREEARAMGCDTIFARKIIRGTHGRGIVEFRADDKEYPDAPLYVEYIPKKAEYRAHVFNGKVIDIQQKKKRKDFEGQRNTRIRNHSNGYVYCRDGISIPDGLSELAVSACEALGYFYGAADIIYNEKMNKCFILEVNTKPGLFGSTLDKYSNAIIEHFDLIRK